MQKISKELIKDKIKYHLSLTIPNLGAYFYFRHYENLSNDKKFITEPEMFLLPAVVSRDDIVFDIGANVGTYCSQLEKLTSARNIYAFEPSIKEFRLLKKLFPLINVFNIAVSNEVDYKNLRIPVLSNGTYLTTRSSLEKIDENVKIEKYLEVKTKTDTIDNIVVRHGLSKIDFMKIDVEGHEYEVLKGAARTIEKMSPVLLIEIEQRHHTFPIEEIFDYVNSFGYSGYFIDRYKKECFTLENFSVERLQNSLMSKNIASVNNFIFFKSQGHEKYLYSIKNILNNLAE